MTIIRSVLLASIILPASARAQNNEPQPCGTITKSITLKQDCISPMVIAADNITVNLNGRTIRSEYQGEDERGGVEIIDRRGVTIKNGTVIGVTYGLLVRRGGAHTFRNLAAKTGADSGVPVRIEDVDHTLVDRVSTKPNFDMLVFRFSGKNSKISHVTALGNEATGAFIRGEALLIAGNKFSSGGAGDMASCGLVFSGERSTIRGNKITTGASREIGALCVAGNGNLIKRNTITGYDTGLELDSSAAGNVIRNNTITSNPTAAPDAVDIRGGENACGNTWKNNKFETDSEGDGPDQGCIR